MKRKAMAIFAAACLAIGLAAVPSPVSAQTFQSYGCADGTQFIVGFFPRDKRAHLQIDGKAVALAKRFALSGAHYSRGEITLRIDKAGTTLKHGRGLKTACSLQ